VVRGDNLAAALAAYWRRIPVMHLDAGRRSGALGTSPAEADRRLLAQVATVHLAATPQAAMNLLDERVVAGDVLLTGGTAIDAVQALAAARGGPVRPCPRPLLLVGVGPAHDEAIGLAMRRLGTECPEVDVAAAAPLPYPERSRMLAAAYLVLTDDVDLAEEAMAAGTPVLVPGDGAGHAEALHAGGARLVEPVAEEVVAAVNGLLESRVRRDSMAAPGSPYGDGLAAARVAQATAALLGHGQFPEPMPARPLIHI
jgi:UDP-N-acetylglucosamine 2-epimerase (non-hydrolysing)